MRCTQGLFPLLSTALLLAFAGSAATTTTAQLSSTTIERCYTHRSSWGVKSVPTKTATYITTVTVPVTVIDSYTLTSTFIVTPSLETTTSTVTSSTTTTTTAPQETETTTSTTFSTTIYTNTLTSTSTSTTISTTTSSSTTTTTSTVPTSTIYSTTTTTTTSVSTDVVVVPTSAGFEPAIDTLPGAAEKRKRALDVRQADVRRSIQQEHPAQPPSRLKIQGPTPELHGSWDSAGWSQWQYPVSVVCQEFVEVFPTVVITVTVQQTTTYTAPTSTSTTITTTATTTTTTVEPVSATTTTTTTASASSTTSTTTSTTTTTTTTTTASTTTTTTTTTTPSTTTTTTTTSTTTPLVTSTSYAACATPNIVGTINVNGAAQGIYDVIYPGTNTELTNTADSDAYDCCVSCITNPLCAASAFYGGFAPGAMCFNFVATTGCSSEGEYSFGATYDNVPADSVYFVSNGNCGDYNYVEAYTACKTCGQSCTRQIVSARNPNGNSGRPCYTCINGRHPRGFSTWDDSQGIVNGNPQCWCGFTSRWGTSNGPNPTDFYSCPAGKCRYFKDAPLPLEAIGIAVVRGDPGYAEPRPEVDMEAQAVGMRPVYHMHRHYCYVVM